MVNLIELTSTFNINQKGKTMEKIWKWIILAFIVIVLGVFTWVAWDYSMLARWIMIGADAAVIVFLIIQWIKYKK